MATIGNIVLFVLGLSLLIFIHEFGHFIFAKLFKVYCLEFSRDFCNQKFGTSSQ